MPSIKILTGDWIERLRELPDGSVQCCVTSPPYWGLRDYGVPGQLGLEKTPEEYVEKLVAGFREVRRVLELSGTVWLNLGDCYATGAGSARSPGGKCFGKQNPVINGNGFPHSQPNRMRLEGLKPKDLVGIPWRVAFALQADGWYLRSDIIWHKPNPMPESVTDRPTKSHEYIFLLSKSERYKYDAEAIKEPAITDDLRHPYGSQGMWEMDGRPAEQRRGGSPRRIGKEGQNSRIHRSRDPQHAHEYNGKHRNELEDARTRRLLKNVAEARANGGSHDNPFGITTRNKRSVWTVPVMAFSGAHFATFPAELITPCILAGSRPGDTVIDPFFGSGTVGQVSLELGRNCIGIELNPKYVEMAERRSVVTPGLALA